MRSSILFELKGNLHVGGFRPFMWKIASEAGLSGWIANSEQGVLLRLEGEEEQISEFIRKIPSAVPNAFYMKEIRLVRREPSGPLDLRNIATTAELIIDCSLARKESRGLHYNADYPVLESEMNGVDTIVQRNLKYYD